MKAEIGDYVELHLSRKIYDGVLLEVPKSEKGVVLLKLDNGYNIGFNKKDVLELKVKKKFEKGEKLDKKIEKDSKKPNVAMIITGGTIASKLDPKTGGVSWLTDTNDFLKFYPELLKIVNISKIEVPFMKGSEDMDYKDWIKIAKTAEKLLNDENVKGLIITHGTDVLHYTASALSFMLKDLNKPVVLTYSQRSIDRGSSDANLNLQCAALAAISDIAEVMLVGHGSSEDTFCYALRGTKVRKLHSSKRDAFKAVNEKPLMKIYSAPKGVHQEGARTSSRPRETSAEVSTKGNTIEIMNEHKIRKSGKVKVDAKFEEKVALLKFYPGQDPSILDYYVDKKFKGIVIEMVGLGHVATMKSRQGWTKKLKEVQDKGLIVCAAAQTMNGRLDPLVYSNGREILDTGVIYLKDMLSETAFVKLGWVLGHVSDKKKVREMMLENISGEFNDRLEE
jgi:glutamyl-tRNA(Gln) amidotransferase subunit D